ncbi:MAG TPA: hypothetical protein VJV21_08015 [Pyrinomonadaceae bacterium]|nr:hypothetical protein [Pyrinomonadaceae bacterium]
MVPEEYAELVEELVSKTHDGTIEWKTTVNQREFLAYFDKFTLSTRGGTDDEENSYVTVTLKDTTGRNLDSFTIWDSDPDWMKLSDVHNTARRRALNIDGAIRAIVTELRAKKKIGPRPEPSPEDDEEVPF